MRKRGKKSPQVSSIMGIFFFAAMRIMLDRTGEVSL
jgi:hypothetical protein